jgi:nucleoside-diphosphate-sugar epimerase
MTRQICVTGASGKAGRAVVRELLEHGYDVAPTDIAAARDDIEGGMLRADLADYGQAIEALRGAEAVIHLANIPAPGVCTPQVTFNANITMNFNIFQAAASLGLNRVVWASSETYRPRQVQDDQARCAERRVEGASLCPGGPRRRGDFLREG